MRMKRILLALIFSFALAYVQPISAAQMARIEISEPEFESVSITVTDGALRVTGANGQVLQVYNVAGVCVMSVKIEGQDKRIDMNLPKGCYIVKVAKVVRKISIK